MKRTQRTALLTLSLIWLTSPRAEANPIDPTTQLKATTHRNPWPPPVARVVEMAIRHSGLGTSVTGSIATRSRWAGLAPWLSLRASHRRAWTNDDLELREGDALEVRATWRLDRLVFDESELRARSMDDARMRARRDLAQKVIRLYYQRARTDAELAPGWEIAEIDAELSFLTGGWWCPPVNAVGTFPPAPVGERM